MQLCGDVGARIECSLMFLERNSLVSLMALAPLCRDKNRFLPSALNTCCSAPSDRHTYYEEHRDSV